MYSFAQTSYSILDDIMTDISSPFNKNILSSIQFLSVFILTLNDVPLQVHVHHQLSSAIGPRGTAWMQIWLLIGCRSLRPSFSGQFHGFFQHSMERQRYWKGGRGLITIRKLIWELLEAAVPGKILHWFSLYSLKCLMRNAFLPLLSKKFVQIYI